MALVITQKPDSGFLGGPKQCSFSIQYQNADYDVNIQQYGIRIITIDTINGNYDDTLSVYYALENLIMLFDGRFYPTESANDGTDITLSWKERMLPSRISADFMMYTDNKLLEYEQVLNKEIFEKWLELSEKIDLINKMVLYCLSSVKMPKDMQCAYMIEAYKGICDLIHDQDKAFAPSLFTGKEPNLKMAFLAVAKHYGQDIFEDEFLRNAEQFAQILINSRNRIAHINNNKKKQVLADDIYVWYIVKLSLLYRVTLFSLLGITQNKFDQNLKTIIQRLNNYPGMKKFMKTLTKDQTSANDPNLKMDIYDLLYSFVYSTAIYQAIKSRRKAFEKMTDDQKRFWASVSDNCLQQAVVDWCKVFGSYDERTHYTKINDLYIKGFEQTVIGRKIDFAEYSKRMKNFRDTYIAHRDEKKKRKPIPNLNSALAICFLYENMVICGDPWTIPFDLNHFYKVCQNTIKQYFNLLGVLL